MSNITPVDRLKSVLNAQSVQEQFKNALKEGAALFTTSIIDLYNSDNTLQKCSPQEVVIECLKAATLKLPINKNLGFAYVIPYEKSKNVNGQWIKEAHPQFQLGYKGYIQLAMRTGQYKFLNVGIVFEGMQVEEDILSGALTITGRKTGSEVLGYFAYMEMINGFKKAVYWTKEEVYEHAKKYSKSWVVKDNAFNSKSAWATNFDEMAQKTLIRNLISKFGIMSVEMMGALVDDAGDEKEYDKAVKAEIESNANEETIDIVPEEAPQPAATMEAAPEF